MSINNTAEVEEDFDIPYPYDYVDPTAVEPCSLCSQQNSAICFSCFDNEIQRLQEEVEKSKTRFNNVYTNLCHFKDKYEMADKLASFYEKDAQVWKNKYEAETKERILNIMKKAMKGEV